MTAAGRVRIAAVALLSLALAFCSRPARTAASRPAAGPAKTEATVVTLRVVSQPGDVTTRHELLIAGGRVRSTDEIDHWRLFDMNAGTVTFVDDVARTFRRETRATLIEEKSREILAAPRMPAFAVVERDPVARTIDGYAAQRLLIRLGAFERELWITESLPIDPGFFSLYNDAEPLDPNGIRAMRDVIVALDQVRGYPVVDHVRFAWGEHSIDVETRVESVGARSVDSSMFRIPRGYRDLIESPGGPPSDASPPSGRSTRAEESRPSGTDRNAP